MAKSKKKIATAANEVNTVSPTVQSKKGLLHYRFFPHIILVIFTFLIYANSISNKYAIDDTMVITDNEFTKKGIAGVKDIFTHDAFEGYFGERGASLVAGGRYRPLSIATFAVEYEITRRFLGDNRTEISDANLIKGDEKVDPYLVPGLSHFINVLLFCAVVFILYHVLISMLHGKKDAPFYATFTFVTALLFAAHPIHTEAVTNIKGRDEVLGLFFGLSALYAAIKFTKTENLAWVFLGVIMMFFGMLSKENVITFLAIVPLTYYFFTKTDFQKYAMVIILYAVPVGVYLALRFNFTKAGIMSDSPEILNNPFAYVSGYEEKFATTIYTFLLYFKLLLFPHPLSHDYYFNEIPYVKIASPQFIFSLLVNVVLIGYALYNIKNKKLPAYAILFYYITFSVVSNILFTVGVLLNERFVFFSSVGFCMLLAYAIFRLIHIFKLDIVKFVPVIAGLIVLLYSIKTITRNNDWHDNYTLFLNDVKYSTNSAKLLTSVGGDMTKEAEKLTDSLQRKSMMEEALTYLDRALTIYPGNSTTLLLKGRALFLLDKKSTAVIPIFTKIRNNEINAPNKSGSYVDATYNIGCVYNENGQPELAKTYFFEIANSKEPTAASTYLLAETYYKTASSDSAILWYKKYLTLLPTNDEAYYKIGITFGRQKNNLDSSIYYLNKAIAINPTNPLYYEDLGVAYGLKKEYQKSIEISLAGLKVDPQYVPCIRNLAITYMQIGDKAKANEYGAKIGLRY